MRLTIFSRVMLAQSILIALILAVSLYSLTKLHLLTQLNTDVLAVDSACINEEKRLLKTFLAEMRNAEKCLLLGDAAFYESFTQSSEDFAGVLAGVTRLLDTDHEKEMAAEIGRLHSAYGLEFQLAAAGGSSFEQNKSQLSDGIIEKTNELIRLREQSASARTAMARDQAASAADVMLWLTLGGFAGALVFAFLHARGMSRPLTRLSEEMRRVGRGEFSRSIESMGPKEVRELAEAFNSMAEELAHLDRLKGDFTAHVSHELRTPLTAIREGTALLLEEIPGQLSESQREILEVVRGHSERLSQSISSILDLSKMEAEMMEYELALCDIGSIVGESVQAIELISRKRGIQLLIDIGARVPMLLIDGRRIRQVLDNLLSNALKFTPEGGNVRVSARVKKKMAGGGMDEVEVMVADTGQGIPQDEINNIFKQFYQSTNNKARGQQGTGLGLAIARHIVEAHKGRIWAESIVGMGSVFHFTLPVLPAAGAMPSVPSADDYPKTGRH
jgi:two-component system, NtrC family, sensor histidine kinase GlrK